MSITRLDDGGQPAAVGPSLRDRKKRRTRERLYDAALQLFAERRYEDVTVDEICDRAEVGRATFFRFFGSKAGLLVEFNHRLAGRIGGRLSDAPDDKPTAELWMVQEEIAAAWGSSALSTRDMARSTSATPPPPIFATPLPPNSSNSSPGSSAAARNPANSRRDHDANFVAWIILASLSAITAGWLDTGNNRSLARGTHDCVGFLLAGLGRVDG